MVVYVDGGRIRRGRMKFSHMWADTPTELFTMARAIGVDVKWIQEPPAAQWVHFDIGAVARARAVKAGAVEATRRELATAARAQPHVPAYRGFYQ